MGILPKGYVLMEYLEVILEVIKQWYWLPMLLLYIGVISAILIENGNPTKTISWILVIIFLPVVGLLLYYLFGQKYTKVKRIQRSTNEQADRLKAEWTRLEPYMERDLALISHRIGGLSRVYSFLKNEKLSSPTLGNKVTLLTNGEEMFKHLLVALRQATHSIHLEYYIFDMDQIGREVMGILEEKAASGVHVRLLLDSFGSPETVKYFRKKKNSKIDFRPCLPVTFSSLANSNYRNHRKIAVIDTEIAFIGGINVSDKYINESKRNNRIFWRDTAVKIEGAAVNMLQISFWNAWNLADGHPYILDDGYLKDFIVDYPLGDAAVSFISSDPGSIGPHNMEAILVAIGEADHRVQLVTPYYVPSDELATALKVAAAAGIEVELMLPESSDSYIVQHASLSFIKPLLTRGVKVYFYKKGFIHAKTISIDGKLCFIGTVNLDIRSFYINYEIAAVIADETLCAQMEEQFARDKEDCVLMTLREWKKRNRWKRGLDSVCRLLAPLL